MTRPRVHLLIIDPQNDFCDLPADWRPADPLTGASMAPALPVAGAHGDLQRLAGFIDRIADRLDAISVTLDSHHRYHIAHPTFWTTGTGQALQAVQPFTQITGEQVRRGDFRPCDASALPRALAYIDALEQRGRYTLMVWPVHCEIGSWGHNVHSAVKAACNRWEDTRQAIAQKIPKGSNPWTENYSALQAEVPDPHDAATQLNTALVARLDAADLLVVAGEASSHCVKATTEDLVANLPSGRPDKVVLLTDCMSPVGGFEAQHRAFLEAMTARGVRLATSTELSAELGG